MYDQKTTFGYRFPDLYVPLVVIDIHINYYLYLYATSDGTCAVLISKEDSGKYFEFSAASGYGGMGWVPVSIAVNVLESAHLFIIDYYKHYTDTLESEHKLLLFMIGLIIELDKAFVHFAKDHKQGKTIELPTIDKWHVVNQDGSVSYPKE